jgi:G6PDH family F420-dependent oxidoreductase
MVRIGLALSSEEYGPHDLIEQCVRAEEAGFAFAIMSDHYHPWTTAQGQSPFVWGVLGAVAARTSRIELGTGVTCPGIRMHPAITAQAAATASVLAGGRFFLGVGTGERLNEHVVGAHWPPPPTRRDMLEESVAVMRGLWTGELVNHRGTHYTVEQAQLFTKPVATIPVMVAAGGPESAELAGRIGDSLVITRPQADLVEAFERAGSGGPPRPRFGQVLCGYAASGQAGREMMLRQWPNAVAKGALGQELAHPRDYEDALAHVRLEDLEDLPSGPDPQTYIEAIQQYIDAGLENVYIHQVGDVLDFIAFARREILPALDLDSSRIFEPAAPTRRQAA